MGATIVMFMFAYCCAVLLLLLQGVADTLQLGRFMWLDSSSSSRSRSGLLHVLFSAACMLCAA
jgi:hypothetical protein